jgi:hypothetical protein
MTAQLIIQGYFRTGIQFYFHGNETDCKQERKYVRVRLGRHAASDHHDWLVLICTRKARDLNYKLSGRQHENQVSEKKSCAPITAATVV